MGGSRVRLEEVVDKVFHLNFPTQIGLGRTFLRFQEHYESPYFSGKFFSRREFIDWYKQRSSDSRFTYYSDWCGFNIPSRVLVPFQTGRFDPLSKCERSLLGSFAGKQDPFYIIGTYGKEDRTLKHEIAHGMFFTRPPYKKKVLDVLSSIPAATRTAINEILSFGYHKKTWVDETHAYILTDLDYLLDRKIDRWAVRDAHNSLEALFTEYYAPKRGPDRFSKDVT